MINLILGKSKIPKEFSSYKELIPFLDKVEGWLSTSQGELLFNLLKNLKLEGDVIEIGSFKGKSTICLGHALKASEFNNGKVFAIDPHTGGIAYVEKHPEAIENLNSLSDFLLNIVNYNINDVVVPIVCRSSDAINFWSRKKIKFVYVDGWHSYEAAYNDIIRWGKLVVPGGIVAVDDYGWEEVKSAVHDAAKFLDIKAEPEIFGDNLAVLYM